MVNTMSSVTNESADGDQIILTSNNNNNNNNGNLVDQNQVN